MKTKKSFASDNYSGVHPIILEAIAKCNRGHAPAYGEDSYTSSAISRFQEHFGDTIDVYFVFNGTGANIVALKTLLRPYHSVICAQTSHIVQDECGAPEQLIGCKLVSIETPDGKITAGQVQNAITHVGDQHHSQPGAVSITQATEYGTVYTPDEIRQIARVAREHGLYLHLDGARICNAAASLGCSLREITFDAGVDVVSFGGTKNGMMYGEAVLFANRKMAQEAKYIRKQSLQLGSKMRFVAAQFKSLLSHGLWLENAMQANRMAQLLAHRIAAIPAIEITQRVDANSVFAIVPPEIVPALQKEFPFYVWDEKKSEVRWMCSFDTVPEDIAHFVSSIEGELKRKVASDSDKK